MRLTERICNAPAAAALFAIPVEAAAHVVGVCSHHCCAAAAVRLGCSPACASAGKCAEPVSRNRSDNCFHCARLCVSVPFLFHSINPRIQLHGDMPLRCASHITVTNSEVTSTSIMPCTIQTVPWYRAKPTTCAPEQQGACRHQRVRSQHPACACGWNGSQLPNASAARQC